jgi:hypothetical protein
MPVELSGFFILKMPIKKENKKLYTDKRSIKISNMKDFNKLIERSYESIKKRGLINEHTQIHDFVKKIKEEHQEFLDEWEKGVFVDDHTDPFYLELMGSIVSQLMLLRFLKVDILRLFEIIVIKNETRRD